MRGPRCVVVVVCSVPNCVAAGRAGSWSPGVTVLLREVVLTAGGVAPRRFSVGRYRTNLRYRQAVCGAADVMMLRACAVLAIFGYTSIVRGLCELEQILYVRNMYIVHTVILRVSVISTRYVITRRVLSGGRVKLLGCDAYRDAGRDATMQTGYFERPFAERNWESL